MVKDVDLSIYPRVTFRLNECFMREIDAAWTSHMQEDPSVDNRSAGVKWLIRLGLESLKKHDRQG